HFAALVTENDIVVRADPKRRGIVGMDHHGRPFFLRQRRRRLVKGRIEEAAGGGRREPKWMLAIRDFDRRPVVGKPRHVRNWAALAGTTERNVRPVRFEPE